MRMIGLKVLGLTVLAGLMAVSSLEAQTLGYTSGLRVWLDAQDMNGNGDANQGWSDGDQPSTSKHWVNKGSAGNPNRYGRSGAGSPFYRPAVATPRGLDRAALEFSTSIVQWDNETILTNDTASVFVVFNQKSRANANQAGQLAQDLFRARGPAGDSVAVLSFALNKNTGAVIAIARDEDGERMDIDWTGMPEIPTNSLQVGLLLLSKDGSEYTFEVGMLDDAIGTATVTSSAPAYTQFGVDDTSIGAFGNGDNLYFVGYIFEVLVYNHALASADRAAVEAYLDEKYITAPPAGTVIMIK